MDIPAAGGGPRKTEAPEGKSKAAYETDAFPTKGLEESKDHAYGALQAEQNETASTKAQMADQEKKMEDRSLRARSPRIDSYKMAAPAQRETVAASAAAKPQASVLLRVLDLNAASSEAEKILAGYGAKEVTRQPLEGKVVMRAEVAGRVWKEVLTKLKGIGFVEEKVLPSDIGESSISVLIEISGR
jgi:hypothetical protein